MNQDQKLTSLRNREKRHIIDDIYKNSTCIDYENKRKVEMGPIFYLWKDEN